MPRETWTKEEDDIIRANHDKMSRKELANLIPGHTYVALRGRIRTLGFASKLTASERLKLSHERGDGYVGDEYERWTIIKDKELTNQGGRTLFHCLCRCDCGVERYVLLTNLRRLRSKSCGCLTLDATSERVTTHGMSKTRLYRIWCGMLRRCYNLNDSSYPDYGKRGIYVCDEWRSFETFRDWAQANGYSDDLQIHRKDNDGPYHPENCKWADFVEQANSRRNNHKETFLGEAKTLAEWSRDPRCVPNYDLLQERVAKGWDFERALRTPVKESGFSEEELRNRVRARWAVKSAIKCGVLIKPNSCEHPGCESAKPQGHHHAGYDRENWLNVKWLCAKHHAMHEQPAVDLNLKN